MDDTTITLIAAIAVAGLTACILTYVLARNAQKGTIARLEAGNDALQDQLEAERKNAEQRVNEIKSQAAQQLAQVREDATRRLEEARQERQQQAEHMEQTYNERLRLQDERHNAQVKDMQAQHAQQMLMQREQQNEQLTAFRAQLENTTRNILEQRQDELQRGNTQQMDALLTPLKERLEEMKKAFAENQEASTRNSASFEAQLKTMMERSLQMGQEAQRLTEALKNKGKVQGDWGEQLLSSILENSGLRAGIEYEVQENVKDEAGNNLRPDVIVHCSDGRNVIIDSKVSLTGFYNYVNAATEEERLQAERENLTSVKSHIRELTEKNYCKLVKDAVPTVLMFVPNEGSYILALQKDPQIANEAMRKGVLIINPTNLMLALMMICQLWQNERREENDRRIVDAATKMYEKFCTFTETFERVGDQLRTVQGSYDKARTQLSEGNGNLMKRMLALQEMGVTSGKQIPQSLQNQ